MAHSVDARGPGENLYAWSQVLTSQCAPWQHTLSKAPEITLMPGN